MIEPVNWLLNNDNTVSDLSCPISVGMRPAEQQFVDRTVLIDAIILSSTLPTSYFVALQD